MTTRSLIAIGFLYGLAACGEVPPSNSDKEHQHHPPHGADSDQNAALTCASNNYWDPNSTPSALMNPGLACRACHQTQAPEMAYYFAGTVFTAIHEADLCNSPPPHGGKIEILDANGNVTLTLTPSAAGNFISNSVAAGVPLPYRARVVVHGETRVMASAQISGDCNSCHTEQGLSGAPGRIMWPEHLD